jgi:hypothetical protein
MSSVMLLIPRRVQLTDTDAHELIARLEASAGERAAANAISRIRFALTDNNEQTLTPSEAAAVHAVLSAWLSEDPPTDPTTHDRLEKLHKATSPI